jgi:phage shock protein PspC (stress-responsive transcriptional regulator)
MATKMTDPTTEPTSEPMSAPTGWRHVPLARVPKGGHEGGKLGGVIAGVCRAYGFEVRSTRAATIVAMVVLPVLIVLYLAAWVLLPEQPNEAQSIDAIMHDRRRLPVLVAIGLVVVAGGVGSFGSWFLFRGVPWGLALLGAGGLLWYSTTRTRTAQPLQPLPPPTIGSDGTLATPVSAPAEATTVTRRTRRPITTIGVGVAVLFAVFVGAMNGAGWWTVSHLWTLVAALGIILVAMLVSIVVNRSWFLPAPFFLLASVIVALCIAQPRLEGGSGQRQLRPTTVAAAEQPQQMSTGDLQIDLRAVPTGGDIRVVSEVGMGSIRITAPTTMRVHVISDIGAGRVDIDGVQVAAGVRQHDVRDLETASGSGTGSDNGTITLDLRTGIGQIQVTRTP